MQENSFGIVISEQAALEALKIAERYEEKSPVLGNHFLETLNLGFEKVASNPEAFGKYKNNNIRRYMLPGLPYKVFYIIEGTEVRVIDIIHTSRSANYIRRKRIR